MQIDQQRAELREHRRRRGAAVHPGPRASFRRDLAAHHHAAVLHVEAEPLDLPPGPAVDPLECAFDDRLPRSGADVATRRALAKEEREGVDEHRLARAGLAGEDVEAGAEVEGDVGNGREVADAELGEHQVGRVIVGVLVSMCAPLSS